MVENVRSTLRDDEVNLFDLLVILWKGKRVMLAFVVISLLCGSVYISLSPVSYNIVSKYSIKLFSVEAQQICGGDILCMAGITADSALSKLEEDWLKISPDTISYHTSNAPESIDRYFVELKDASSLVTNDFLKSAKAEIDIISGFNKDLMNTERIATNILNAERLVYAIETAKVAAIEFSEPRINMVKPKIIRVMGLSIIIGLMLGMMVVLVLHKVNGRGLNSPQG